MIDFFDPDSRRTQAVLDRLRRKPGTVLNAIEALFFNRANQLAVAVKERSTAVAVVVLRIPGLVGPALVALAFYVWGGAADALGGGATPRSVALEFGSLALLGFVVAVLMAHG